MNKKQFTSLLFLASVLVFFTGCNVKMVVEGVAHKDYENYPVIYEVAYDMECSYDNGPTPFLFKLKKGQGFVPKDLSGVKVANGYVAFSQGILPRNTLGLEGIKPNRAGYYWLLVYPNGNFISETTSFMRTVSGHYQIHYGSCKPRDSIAPFKIVSTE